MATLVLVLPIGCRGQATPIGTPSPAKPSAKAQASKPGQPRPSVQPPQTSGKGAAAKAEDSGAHVERVHTSEGIVIITRAPKATPEDLRLPVFPGARETGSASWRLEPPKGREWVEAMGQFSSTRPIVDIEQFYRKALGQPEARRNQSKGETLVVLSRVRDLTPARPQAKGPKKPVESESIVVRLTRAAGAKVTTIVIRRAVRGAPVKIEPSGELPGRPRPRPPRPEGVPVKGV